jgi:hypothetical protein
LAALAAFAIGGTVVAVTPIGGSQPPIRPPLALLRGPHSVVEARLQPLVRRIEARVERIRGLRFRTQPTVQLMSEAKLLALGRRLASLQRRQANLSPARLQASRRLQRANVEFDQLAGLLPPTYSFGPDTRTAGLDRVGGAFDNRRQRIILVPDLIQTRVQLEYTLAHEFDHALESQHFRLYLDSLATPSEAAEVRRAVVEGTATFVQDSYRQRYLHDRVPVAQRLEGMRSVIAAGPSAYAINAQAIFDYVDGGLFVRDLYRRAGGWSLVNRALENPPTRSDQLLHPQKWPESGGGQRVRLGIGRLLRARWRPIGGGLAGEEQALMILLAGTIGNEAVAGASGWDGGRFAVWRPSLATPNCPAGCAAGDVGVVAFRWRHRADAGQFSLAVPAYMIVGLLAESVSQRTWKVANGYASLGTADRGSALAFAPSARLSAALASRAARSAGAG